MYENNLFCHFWPNLWTHILAQKDPNNRIRNSLNNILVKKDRNYIIINFVTLRLSKVKFLKIISFLSFLTQIKQNFGPKHPLNVIFLAKFALNFLPGVCKTTTFSFKTFPMQNMKKPIDNACFFTFSQHWA